MSCTARKLSFKEMNQYENQQGLHCCRFNHCFTFFLELAAHADESDQATTVTLGQPIRIPGRVLAAGTYLFKTVDADSGEHIVQIFSSDRTVQYRTFLTVAAERQEPADHTVITLAELETGQLPVLVNWFYPGRDMEVGLE
jgi:hypothetical protein